LHSQEKCYAKVENPAGGTLVLDLGEIVTCDLGMEIVAGDERVMTLDEPDSRPGTAETRYLPALLLLFAASGCAGLIYEVVWLELLQLVIGSTAVSLGVLLATFMGGMCAGSLLLPRLVPLRWHPLRVYAALELGIAVCGLAVLVLMPQVGAAYSRIAGPGPTGIALRGLLAALILLPPTLLLGASLPAISRWVETTPQGVSWLGLFYTANIAGAVIGCLLAGFYLLRVHDMATASQVAVALNVIVAALALVLAFWPGAARAAPVQEMIENRSGSHTAGGWSVHLAIALSGASALGAEVVWTRLLSLLLGGTVYTFSLILATFLVGLGIGSGCGALVARRAETSRSALGVCQWLLTAAIAWTAVVIARSLPYWPVVPELSPSPWYTFQLDLVRCLFAVLPPACLWGASFPLALAAVARSRGEDPGRLVGGVYAANTIGGIGGSLLFSLVVIPALGTAGAQRVLIGLAAAAASAVHLPVILEASVPSPLRRAVAMTAALVAAGWLAWNVAPVPWVAVAYGRHSASWLAHAAPDIVPEVPQGSGRPDVFCTYVGEGANVSVAVTENREGIRSFHGAGKVQASTLPADMRLQRMLGHIPALLHRKRVRRGGHGGLVRPAPRRQAHRHLRHRAPGSDGRDADVRRGELSRGRRHRRREPARRQRQAGRGGLRRWPALPAHLPREVRHHHLRPDRSLGQGLRCAEHGRVLPDVSGTPQPRRQRQPLDPALREQHGDRQERAGHVLRSLPGGDDVEQRARRPGV
jgi:spermidine synthase